MSTADLFRMEGRVRIREPPADRPVSLYDNLPEDSRPSLAHAMVTTVPQNIAAPKIEGRHAPTRNSLRHSRMIVMTKQGRVPRKYLPHVLERHRLATSLLVLQLLMGIAIATLAAWLLLWAPSLPFRDVPYWSGSPVIMSAIVGLILVCCCRQEYPGMPTKYYVHGFKVVSILCSLFASVAAFCASGFALIHLIRLYKSICEPANVLHASCACRAAAYALTYPDLNCPEVWNILSVLLIGSTTANGFAGFLAAWYVILHWTSRSPRSYTKVATNDSRTIVVTNKL